MVIYTGSKLEEVINIYCSKIKYNRKEVNEITSSFTKNIRIKSIIGERRQGKTTVLRSVIKEILKTTKSNRILYVIGTDSKNNSDKIDEIFRLLDTKEYTHVFIDEIQFFDGYLDGRIQILHDIYSEVYNIKFVITGTWSQYIMALSRSTLFDRVDIFELLPLTFTDSKKYYNRGYTEHLINGGYIQQIDKEISMIDALTSMEKYLNIEVTNTINMSKIRVFNIFISTQVNINYSNFIKFIKRNKTLLLKKFKIEYTTILDFTIDNFKLLIDILNNSKLFSVYFNVYNDYMPFLISRNNILTCSLNNIFKDIYNTNIERDKLGIIFEDNIRNLLLQNNYTANKLSIDNIELGQKEIDIVSDNFIAEIKLSEKFNDNYLKHLIDNDLLKKYNLQNKNKYLIYNGDTVKEKYNGVKIINIYDFEKEFNIKSRMEVQSKLTFNNKANINLKW